MPIIHLFRGVFGGHLSLDFLGGKPGWSKKQRALQAFHSAASWTEKPRFPQVKELSLSGLWIDLFESLPVPHEVTLVHSLSNQLSSLLIDDIPKGPISPIRVYYAISSCHNLTELSLSWSGRDALSPFYLELALLRKERLLSLSLRDLHGLSHSALCKAFRGLNSLKSLRLVHNGPVHVPAHLQQFIPRTQKATLWFLQCFIYDGLHKVLPQLDHRKARNLHWWDIAGTDASGAFIQC